MRNRSYSFSIPFLMDGGLALVQTAMPLLAIRFGTDALFLGVIGASGQGLRMPFCLGAGALSERIGRAKVIVPASALFLILSALLGFTQNKEQVLVVYLFIMPCIGAFYPALQAMIGDISEKGELRKNISAFNIGWCIGGSVFAFGAGKLLHLWQPLPFLAAAAAGGGVMALSLAWARSKPHKHAVDIAAVSYADIPHADRLLLISRMGHFLAFFGFAMARVLYPMLARTEMRIPETEVAIVTAMVLAGQAAGMFITGAGGWWRGKLWPQIASIAALCTASLVLWTASNQIIIGSVFFLMGFSLSVIYTGALYYGMQSRKNIGRNTGIHESLVAAGGVSGSLLGGAAAQMMGLRAPYAVFAALCGLAIVASAVVWRGKGCRVIR